MGRITQTRAICLTHAIDCVSRCLRCFFAVLIDVMNGSNVLRIALAAVIALFVGLAGHVAFSEAARTIKIVVPLAPGGPGDILARLLADEIAQVQGVTIVVENRPGAGTVIGAEAVSRAKP